MVGRCTSYWNSPFLGDMSVFGGVLGGGFKYFGFFIPIWGNDRVLLIFSMYGLVQPPTSKVCSGGLSLYVLQLLYSFLIIYILSCISHMEIYCISFFFQIVFIPAVFPQVISEASKVIMTLLSPGDSWRRNVCHTVERDESWWRMIFNTINSPVDVTSQEGTE